MAGAADVVGGLDSGAATWWALVPNRRGAEMALTAGLRHLTVTVSASPVYSEKNVGMTVAESIAQVESICSLDPDAIVDAVVSCAFGSSFDDAVTAADVASVCSSLTDAGVDLLTLADTTGTATPRRIESMLGHTGIDVGLHLHDTRGTALTNAFAAIEMGVVRFDTAVGGLGGSPFAPGAGGNLATESLVLLLDDLGIETGVRLDALLDIGRRLSEVVGRELPSRVLRAGPLPAFPG
jgi:hydroxymethylglutaryl-CoA lyase